MTTDFKLYLNNDFPYHEIEILNRLISEIDWNPQQYISLYGKSIPQPRLTSWYGDGNYSYSGLNFESRPWSPLLLELKSIVEDRTKTIYNSVLLNYYRDGNDSISFHKDDEKELGENPDIASLSFGDTRTFILKNDSENYKLNLSSGSILHMFGECQRKYVHGIPKEKNKGPRINLTFRKIIS